MVMKRSAAKNIDVPLPPCPIDRVPGAAFALAISSCSVLAGKSAAAARMNGVCARVETDDGACARAVLDHHGLAEQLLELRLHRTCRGIGRPSRRKRHDE